MTISLFDLDPEHQRVRLEAEERIRASIAGYAVEQTVVPPNPEQNNL
jgi:hypothetical protein